MRRNQCPDLCQGGLYKAELGFGIAGEQCRCIELQISQAVLSISQQPPLVQASLLTFSVYCTLWFTPLLFYNFSAAAWNWTRHFLQGPFSSSSALSLLPWKHWDTPIDLALIIVSWLQAVLLETSQLCPESGQVPHKQHNGSFLMLEITVNPNNYSLGGLWKIAGDTVLEINVCCSLLLLM